MHTDKNAGVNPPNVSSQRPLKPKGSAAEADELGMALALLRDYVRRWNACDGQSSGPILDIANEYAVEFEFFARTKGSDR